MVEASVLGWAPRFREGVVLAAGAGIRLRPVTETCPKPLLPLSDGDVILDNIAGNAKGMGLQSLWVIARDHQRQFQQACESVSERRGMKVTLRMLRSPTRTSLDTLRVALRYVRSAPVVFLGDDVTITASSENLVRRFAELVPAVLEAVTREDDVHALQRSCAVAIDGNGSIQRIEEKPTNPDSNIRGCGIYLLGEEAFELLQNGQPTETREITEVINYFAQRRRAAYEFIDGVNINVNTREDLSRAQRYYEDGRSKEKIVP